MHAKTERPVSSQRRILDRGRQEGQSEGQGCEYNWRLAGENMVIILRACGRVKRVSTVRERSPMLQEEFDHTQLPRVKICFWI